MCVCVCVCFIAYVVCLIKLNLVGKAPYCVKKLKISINWIVDFSYAATQVVCTCQESTAMTNSSYLTVATPVASYPGPEKGPGIYCLRMRRHPTFFVGHRKLQ